MIINVSRSRWVCIVYKYLFPDWSESILLFLFFILGQTFVPKANYVYIQWRQDGVFLRKYEDKPKYEPYCLLPTQKLSVQSLFLLFAKKINHILLKIGKKSTKHVTGDFPDNLKRRAYSRNCCLSFRHRRNPSYLNLCLPSESVNSKLRLIVKQACC